MNNKLATENNLVKRLLLYFSIAVISIVVLWYPLAIIGILVSQSLIYILSALLKRDIYQNMFDSGLFTLGGVIIHVIIASLLVIITNIVIHKIENRLQLKKATSKLTAIITLCCYIVILAIWNYYSRDWWMVN